MDIYEGYTKVMITVQLQTNASLFAVCDTCI